MSAVEDLDQDPVARLIRLRDRAVLAALLDVGQADEEEGDPAPLPPLPVITAMKMVPLRLSRGIVLGIERRVIRSHNPVTPATSRSTQ